LPEEEISGESLKYFLKCKIKNMYQCYRGTTVTNKIIHREKVKFP